MWSELDILPVTLYPTVVWFLSTLLQRCCSSRGQQWLHKGQSQRAFFKLILFLFALWHQPCWLFSASNSLLLSSLPFCLCSGCFWQDFPSVFPLLVNSYYPWRLCLDVIISWKSPLTVSGCVQRPLPWRPWSLRTCLSASWPRCAGIVCFYPVRVSDPQKPVSAQCIEHTKHSINAYGIELNSTPMFSSYLSDSLSSFPSPWYLLLWS